ncbi:4-phosphopantetheinyl transferase [Oxalobacteraceae bacterium]|nr:4-phosphopantetheinyl transferase [Oxalobacteraceae bacterium]
MSIQSEIWMARVDASGDDVLAAYLPWLSPAEVLRHSRFMRPERQRQFLIGRVLLRMALAPVLNLAPAAIKLEERAARAPRLLSVPAKGTPPGFSISHSGNWVACAVSAQTAIGLDIEVMDPSRDLMALASQAMDGEVCAQLQALAQQQRIPAFYQAWSEQEARFKLGQCDSPSCVSVAHAELSIVVCSAQPLTGAPQVKMVSLG